MHGCAGLVAALLPLPLTVVCLLELCLLLSLLRQWPRHVKRCLPGSIQTVTWLEGRACRIGLRNGMARDVTLGSTAFVQPWLVIMHFQGRGYRRHYLLLLPEMLDRDSYRRLRVRLRMELQQTSRSVRPA